MARPAPPIKRGPELGWLVTGPLALITGGLIAVLADRSALGAPAVGEWGWGVLFLVLFALADVAILGFRVRRNVMTVSLLEIPLLLGLVFLPPVTLIVMRVLAKAIDDSWGMTGLPQTCRQIGWTNGRRHGARI